MRYPQPAGLVAREREPRERRDHYRVHGGDTWYGVNIRRDEMLMRLQEDLREGAEGVGADTPVGKWLEETRRVSWRSGGRFIRCRPRTKRADPGPRAMYRLRSGLLITARPDPSRQRPRGRKGRRWRWI